MRADLVLVAVAVAIGVSLAAAIVVRFIRPRVERIGQAVEATVKAKLFPARHLDLLVLQRRVVAVALSGVDISVSGDRHLGRVHTIQVSPSDHTRLVHGSDGGLDRVHAELATEIARRAAKLGYKIPDRMEVLVVRSVFALDGRPIRLIMPQSTQSAAPVATPSKDPADKIPSVDTTRSSEPPPPVSSTRRRVVDPLMLEGTRMAATRRWGSDDTVNIDEAKLEPALGGRAIRLAGHRIVVGRRPDAVGAGEGEGAGAGKGIGVDVGAGVDVAIDDLSVSTRHAELLCQAGVWSVVDRQSTNGTYVNGRQVRHRDLTDGDYVQFSSEGPTYVFRLRRESDDTSDTPEASSTSVDRLTTRRSR